MADSGTTLSKGVSNQILVVSADRPFTASIVSAGKSLGWVSETIVTESLDEIMRSAGKWPETNLVMLFGPGWTAERLVQLIGAAVGSGMHPGRVVVAYAHGPAWLPDRLKALKVDKLVNLPVREDNLWNVLRIAGTTGENRDGRLVTVFSSKGGVGTSFVAANIAVIMSRWPGKRVALVDLDLDFGDIGAMLGLLPTKNIYEFAQNSVADSRVELAQYLLRYNGLDVLLAPPRPEQSEMVGSEVTSKALSALRLTHDVVIVDTPCVFNDHVLELVDVTDQLLVVVTPDVAAAKNVKIALQTLTLIKFPRRKIRLILNKLDRQPAAFIEELHNELGMPITLQLVNDPAASVAALKSVPVVDDAPRSRVSRQLRRLARVVGAGIDIEYNVAHAA